MSSPPKKNWLRELNRQCHSLFRWLHIYLSMFSFAAILFFAVTGITLNHPTWLGGSDIVVTDFHGTLPTELLGDPVDQLAIAETLRAEHKLKGRVAEFEIDPFECLIVYKSPGFAADAFVDRDSGEYQLSVSSSNLVAVMNDLHKGRDSGATWSWVIDLSAILMILVSITGIGILFYLKRRRISGIAVGLVGTVVLVLIWVYLVP